MKKLFITSLILLSFNSQAQQTIIHAGTLIDGVSDNALSERSIIVEGNEIIDIKKGFISGKEDDKNH